jgi:hypothetical protein
MSTAYAALMAAVDDMTAAELRAVLAVLQARLVLVEQHRAFTYYIAPTPEEWSWN